MKKLLMLLFFLITLNALSLPSNFEANFTQTITNQNKKIIYKGKIFYKNGKILWKYFYPIKKYIWINNKVYVYEPDLYQVTISPKPKFTLQNIINNAKHLKNDLYKAIVNNKKIYFLYDKTIKYLKYKNKMDNLVEINFSNQSTKKLNPNLFIPNYPKDVDIIYQR